MIAVVMIAGRRHWRARLQWHRLSNRSLQKILATSLTSDTPADPPAKTPQPGDKKADPQPLRKTQNPPGDILLCPQSMYSSPLPLAGRY